MILVTGGTGFVGQEVVKELLVLGYKVRLLARNPKHVPAFFAHHPQIDVFRGDALRNETLAAAMSDVNVVIHLIGIIAETSKINFEQGHEEATRNVLRAAQHAGVTRWIQMSAAGTRPSAASRYHLSKWRAEEHIRQSGLDWTIFRPSLIYGYDEHDRLLNMLRLALNWAPFSCFPLLDGGSPLIQPVSVREVAHCFAHAVTKEASIRQTYDLVGPVAFSWREMVFKIAQACGLKAIYQTVPWLLFLRIALWLTIIFLPALVIHALVRHHLGLIKAELCAGLEAVLIVIACRWKQRIIFGLPGSLLEILANALNSFAPRSLQFSEQLKMARENNVGNPQPAAEMFGYEPERFETALKRLGMTHL